MLYRVPGVMMKRFFNLVQYSFLTQHVLEPTRGENVLGIVLSSQKEFVDNIKICEPPEYSDHNQIYFIINWLEREGKLCSKVKTKVMCMNSLHTGKSRRWSKEPPKCYGRKAISNKYVSNFLQTATV